MVQFKKNNQNVQKLLKFSKIWKYIIESKPIIPFKMALMLTKYRLNVFSDASGIVRLGGLAVINNKIFFWSVTFEFLINRFNKHINFFDNTGSETIQYKEIFALAVNILAFGGFVGQDTAFCLHTDNLRLAANLSKFRARHDRWTNDLIIWSFLYAIAHDILLVPSHVFRERNIEADLLSKNNISGLYALVKSKHPTMLIKRIYPDYSKLFNLQF